MTLTQRAALLDQLKLPIEEAPRGRNKPAIWACRDNDQWMQVVDIEHSKVYGWCGYTNTNYFVRDLTHFLPLPVAGPVESEVVPVGTMQKLRDSIPSIFAVGDDCEATERSYLRGLQAGAEVGRLEGEE